MDFGLSKLFGICAEAGWWNKSQIINLKCPEEHTLGLVLIPSGDARRLANAALTAVAHGGNPHRPWRLPLGENRAASPKLQI